MLGERGVVRPPDLVVAVPGERHEVDAGHLRALGQVGERPLHLPVPALGASARPAAPAPPATASPPGTSTVSAAGRLRVPLGVERRRRGRAARPAAPGRCRAPGGRGAPGPPGRRRSASRKSGDAITVAYADDDARGVAARRAPSRAEVERSSRVHHSARSSASGYSPVSSTCSAAASSAATAAASSACSGRAVRPSGRRGGRPRVPRLGSRAPDGPPNSAADEQAERVAGGVAVDPHDLVRRLVPADPARTGLLGDARRPRPGRRPGGRGAAASAASPAPAATPAARGRSPAGRTARCRRRPAGGSPTRPRRRGSASRAAAGRSAPGRAGRACPGRRR